MADQLDPQARSPYWVCTPVCAHCGYANDDHVVGGTMIKCEGCGAEFAAELAFGDPGDSEALAGMLVEIPPAGLWDDPGTQGPFLTLQVLLTYCAHADALLASTLNACASRLGIPTDAWRALMQQVPRFKDRAEWLYPVLALETWSAAMTRASEEDGQDFEGFYEYTVGLIEEREEVLAGEPCRVQWNEVRNMTDEFGTLHMLLANLNNHIVRGRILPTRRG